MPRPDYNGIEIMQQDKAENVDDVDEEEEELEEEPASRRRKGKQNFEETSEED